MKSIALLIVCFLLGFGIATAQDSSATNPKKAVRIIQNPAATDSIEFDVYVYTNTGNPIPFTIVTFLSRSQKIGSVQVDNNGHAKVKLLYSSLDPINLEAKATGFAPYKQKSLGINEKNQLQISLLDSFCDLQGNIVQNKLDVPPGQFEIDQEMIQHSAYR